MGQRVESYSRDQLRKIALPGNAVATLFWVLPVGTWRMGELDAFWSHFTRPGSLCHDIGLLLVRDTQREHTLLRPDTADLAESLLHAESGSVTDLIPEAAHHGGNNSLRHDRRAFLILSGAYPQPGWGVLAPADQDLGRPERFERLIERVVRHLDCPDHLGAIRCAAQAYHVRFQTGIHSPGESSSPKELAFGFSNFWFRSPGCHRPCVEPQPPGGAANPRDALGRRKALARIPRMEQDLDQPSNDRRRAALTRSDFADENRYPQRVKRVNARR